MKAENCAQKILRHTEKAAADLEVLLEKYAARKEETGKGITIRHLTDDSIVVCDYSGYQAPHWYERSPNGWSGEGEAARKRLAETKGTVWVVDLPSSQFRVFESEPDAELFCMEQLHLDKRNAPLSPVRYVDGQRPNFDKTFGPLDRC